MSRRLRRSLLAALAATALAACETGPHGPGTVNGTVVGQADLAGAVLDVVWGGVRGFEGHGSTQVYSAAVAGEEDHYRVILISPTGGDLTFGILVDGDYLRGPVVTVVEAVGSDNLPRSEGDLRVWLER
jgi:hypothetical protein